MVTPVVLSMNQPPSIGRWQRAQVSISLPFAGRESVDATRLSGPQRRVCEVTHG
jgi:hypothetical protein